MGYLHVAFRLLPIDRLAIIKALFCRGVMVAFFLGIMLSHSVYFAPKCSTCDTPQKCLVYTECLKHGSVMLDGSDACRQHFRWSPGALEALFNATNVSAADMACEREDVWCTDVEELTKWNCPSLDHLQPEDPFDDPCHFPRGWW